VSLFLSPSLCLRIFRFIFGVGSGSNAGTALRLVDARRLALGLREYSGARRGGPDARHGLREANRPGTKLEYELQKKQIAQNVSC
jgi:hypothetical protein